MKDKAKPVVRKPAKHDEVRASRTWKGPFDSDERHKSTEEKSQLAITYARKYVTHATEDAPTDARGKHRWNSTPNLDKLLSKEVEIYEREAMLRELCAKMEVDLQQTDEELQATKVNLYKTERKLKDTMDELQEERMINNGLKRLLEQKGIKSQYYEMQHRKKRSQGDDNDSSNSRIPSYLRRAQEGGGGTSTFNDTSSVAGHSATVTAGSGGGHASSKGKQLRIDIRNKASDEPALMAHHRSKYGSYGGRMNDGPEKPSTPEATLRDDDELGDHHPRRVVNYFNRVLNSDLRHEATEAAEYYHSLSLRFNPNYRSLTDQDIDRINHKHPFASLENMDVDEDAVRRPFQFKQIAASDTPLGTADGSLTALQSQEVDIAYMYKQNQLDQSHNSRLWDSKRKYLFGNSNHHARFNTFFDDADGDGSGVRRSLGGGFRM
eukprot:GFYU01006212.1.p1 GENE.GFYU01006212.1~~GFYU01006212.1.p1  ORF type:complete len:436 (-),score=106.47 GFYU01006212.1:223-1530(-)